MSNQKTNIIIRVSIKEKDKIKNLAKKHNLSVSGYMRTRSLNKRIRTKTNKFKV